jgi:hypothetical protein
VQEGTPELSKKNGVSVQINSHPKGVHRVDQSGAGEHKGIHGLEEMGDAQHGNAGHKG